MKTRTVNIHRVTNRDGSITFGLRWPRGGGKTHYKRVLRTERTPTKTSLSGWEREVARRRLDKEGELNDESAEYVVHRRVPDAYAEYVSFCRQAKSDSTATRVDRVIGHFIDYMADNDGPANASGIRLHHLARWRDYLLERGLRASTVNCYLADLGGWFRWMIGESYAVRNVARDVNRVPTASGRANPPIQTAAQFADVLDCLELDTQRATAGLLGCTGLRISEAANLHWIDWDQEGHTLRIRKQGRESNKRHHRTLPVCQRLREFLMVLLIHNTEGPYIIGTQRGRVRITSQVNTWLKPLGLSPHDFRRFFRTALESFGDMPNYLIDDLLGHTTGKVRRAYTPEQLSASTSWIRGRFQSWLNGAAAERGKP